MLQPKATKDADSYVECATWTGYTTWPQAAQIGRITRAGCAARAGCVTRASMHATLPAFTHALLTMPAHTAPHDTRAADRIQGIVPISPPPSPMAPTRGRTRKLESPDTRFPATMHMS